MSYVCKEQSNTVFSKHSTSVTGGPKADRGPFTEANCLTTESLCCEAIALMKHSADEAIVKEKMKQTFTYRQKMLHDPVKSSEIFTVFPRFLDIPGMVCGSLTALLLFYKSLVWDVKSFIMSTFLSYSILSAD